MKSKKSEYIKQKIINNYRELEVYNDSSSLIVLEKDCNN